MTSPHRFIHPRFMRVAAIVVCLAALTACQRANDRADSLDPAALLALRFAGEAGEKPVDLRPIGRDVVTRDDIAPLEVVKFDETHALLLTEAQTEEDCHACGGVLGAYFYERDAKGWRLVRAQDAAMAAGVNGRLGKVSVTALQGTLHAGTIEWGSCWQGTCGSWLVVLALEPYTLRELGSLPLAINNDGRFGACELLDQAEGKAKPDAPNPDNLTPEERACQDIESDWKFEGTRLLVNFKGRLLEAKDSALLPLRKIDQRAVYSVGPTELKLVDGENPVPAF